MIVYVFVVVDLLYGWKLIQLTGSQCFIYANIKLKSTLNRQFPKIIQLNDLTNYTNNWFWSQFKEPHVKLNYVEPMIKIQLYSNSNLNRAQGLHKSNKLLLIISHWILSHGRCYLHDDEPYLWKMIVFQIRIAFIKQSSYTGEIHEFPKQNQWKDI